MLESMLEIEEKVIEQHNASLELDDKDIIIVNGFTGCGKSTFCQVIEKGAESIEFDDEEDCFTAAEPAINHNKEEVFQMGNRMVACT